MQLTTTERRESPAREGRRAHSDGPALRLIALAPNPWQGQWVNRQHLLSRLARKHRVVYSTGAWSIWDRQSPEWRRASVFGRVQPCDGVSVEEAPRLLLRWPKWRRFDQLVVRLHAARLRAIAQRAGQPPTVAFLFHPAFLPYADFLAADLLAYHAYDLFEATPGWSPELEDAEVALLRAADLVTAASESIALRLREKVARDVKVLPNGVDFDAFDFQAAGTSPIPPDLAAIPGPRLGYVGSLHPQVDYGLVAALAESRPQWNFVLIGGSPAVRDARAEGEIERCRRLPNVRFLGEKHRDEVPRYLWNMDVNLMLYRVSDRTWIKAGYPLKLHEYLAAGRPVVSADLPAVREFASVVRIATDFGDWLRGIEEALLAGGVGTSLQRRAVAARNSWDARVASLDDWLVSLAPGRQAAAVGD